MRATVLTGIGDTTQLQYTQLAAPQLLPGYARVKVSYCGVNHLDTLIRQGKRPGPQLFPHILGSEIVGTVTEISGEVESIAVGTAVAVYPWLFDGTCRLCQQGFENICDKMGTIGRTSWGGYAEEVCVPAHNLLPLPSIDHAQACSVILAGTTAVHLLQRAQVVDGGTVLITGASGGVGTLLMQLLKQRHCTVICASAHPKKAAQLKKLGADYIVSTDQLVAEMKQLFPAGVQYAFDIVGGAMWSASVEVLGKNGTLVYCATSRDEVGQVQIGSAFSRQLNILGSYGGTRQNMSEALALVEKQQLKPIIEKIFPLAHASQAHLLLDEQRVVGKLLLKVD